MTDVVVDLRNERNILTVFSDTSLCHETGAAGYGVWMRDSQPGKLYGGTYDQKIISSNMGEFLAVLRALIHAEEDDLLSRVHYVVFVCDNQRVVDLLNGSNTAVDWERKALLELRQILGKYKLDWKANKVKAHSGTGKPRTWVNDQCDKMARKHMLEQRQQLRGK